MIKPRAGAACARIKVGAQQQEFAYLAGGGSLMEAHDETVC